MPRRVIRQSRGTRRPTTWVQSTDETSFTTVAAATAVLDQSLVSGDPTTIVRTRGQITVISDQAAAGERPFGALGMNIVSAEALAAGAASIPPPYSNSGDDGWFLHQFFDAPVRFGSGVGFNNISKTFAFDSKAMRKVSPDDRIVVMVENGSAADGLVFLLSFRMLLKTS